MADLRFKEMKRGYVKVSDGTQIVMRTAVVDAIPIGSSPFEVDFNVTYVVGISVHASNEAKEEVKDRPLAPPSPVTDGWKTIRIAEKDVTFEEVEYLGDGGEKYIIRVEVEPLMVSKNTAYRAVDGSPLYIVRWAPKISWYRGDNA